MNIAISDTDMRRLFSLFPAVVEEFRDCLRVYSSDVNNASGDECKSPVFLAKQKYISNMSSIINISNEIIGSLEDYSGEINDGFACIDLMRGLTIYGANRRKEVDRAVKTASGKSFVINNNHTTNVYGLSLFEKSKDGDTDKIEDLTYIFDSSIKWAEMRTQLGASMAKGIKALMQLMEDGKKIDEMESVPPELFVNTQDIRSVASLFYNTREWVQAFVKKHKDSQDNYEIYQYFFLFYASFARKFYANYWQYRVENHEALNIHSKLVACLK